MLPLTRFFPTVAFGVLALAASSTNAQTTSGAPFKLLEPTILGSGCPPGTAWAEVSADGQAISILFSEYAANANETVARMRRTCNFALPVEAAPGKSLGFYQVDFRGWAYVPPVEGASGNFMNEYFFAGQRGPSVKKTYDMGADEPIFDSTSIQVQSVIWSPCGGSTNFRINSALTAMNPLGKPGDVQMQIDSLDATVSGQVQVFVDSRDCTPTSAPTTPPPTTAAPTTPAPTTPTPTTLTPTTPAPTTHTPAPAPTTPTPTTRTPQPTPMMTTPAPATQTPAPTPVITTPAPTTQTPPPTPAITTPAPTTEMPAPTPVMTTLAPTPPPTTPTPSTPMPSTPMPSTPMPSTPTPTTPASTTPRPTTSAPTLEMPTPAPTSAEPTPSPASATASP